MFNTLKVISQNMGLFLYFNLQKMPVSKCWHHGTACQWPHYCRH